MGFSELREWARTSALTGKGYRLLKEGIRRERRRRLSSGPHRFLNRQRGERILLLVIAGYKPWLYRLVFPRLKSFLPDFPMDLCLLSGAFGACRGLGLLLSFDEEKLRDAGTEYGDRTSSGGGIHLQDG